MLNFDHPQRAGFLPHFAGENDPRSFQEQVNERYIGGWNPFHGFTLGGNSEKYFLAYPGDPPMREVARAKFRNQTIVLFQYDWVAVIENGKLVQVARLD